MKNNKGHVLRSKVEGFTLIEMLVVIAIIGLLSSVVLVALGPSRDKARDVKIISDVTGAATVAEILYNSTLGTYPTADMLKVDKSFINLTNDANSINSDTSGVNSKAIYYTLDTNSHAFSVSAKLVTDATKFYCKDSSGKTITSATNGSSGVCP